MGERPPFDHSLGGIVVDVDAFELGQELVAVAHAGAEPAGCPRLGKRALHAVLAQRVGARPFRRLAAVAALHARFQRSRAGQRGEDSGAAGRIVARARPYIAVPACPPDIPARARSSGSPAASALRHLATALPKPPPTTLPSITPRTPRRIAPAHRTRGPAHGWPRRDRPHDRERRPVRTHRPSAPSAGA